MRKFGLLFAALAMTASSASASVSPMAPAAGPEKGDMVLTVQVDGGKPVSIAVPRRCVALFGQSMAEWAVAVTRPYDLALPASWPGEEALKCLLTSPPEVPTS
jgi:hypothetical protein